MERPGDGDEVVYSPVGVNVTVSCTVRSTSLFWVIDGVSYSVALPELSSRGIFLQQPTSSTGTVMSSLFVFGEICNSCSNTETSICCQTLVQGRPIEACTTLRVYGKTYIPLKMKLCRIILCRATFTTGEPNHSLHWKLKFS